MPRAAPRYCLRKGATYYGRMSIPPDASPGLGGKKQFMVPLHEIDPHRAAAAVAPLVAEWKARIAAVRAGLHDPMRDEIDRLAAEFRKLNSPMTDADARLVVKTIDFVFQKIGGMAAVAQHRAIADARGDVLQALRTAPNAGRAVNAMQRIAGSGEARRRS
ncbi:MAG: hypothetical protein WA864_11705 [Acetobacteraceae bacterium]